MLKTYVALAVIVALWATLNVTYAEATVSCDSWKVEKVCCPAACEARRSAGWSIAEGALRGCMVGIGCSSDEANHATIFQSCHCK